MKFNLESIAGCLHVFNPAGRGYNDFTFVTSPHFTAWVRHVGLVVAQFAAVVAASLSAAPLDYSEQARTIVNSLKPQAGEEVIVRYDPGYFHELLPLVRQRLLAAGTGRVIELEYGPIGSGAVFDPAAGRPQAPQFERLLRATDIYIQLPERVGVVETPPVEAALLREWLEKGGKRRQIHFHWSRGSVRADGLAGEHTTALDEIYQTALGADGPALGRAQDAVIHWLRLGTARVQTPAGTDLRFRVGTRPFNKQDGDASAIRMLSARTPIDREIELPAGVLRVAPVEESVDGVIVIPEARFDGKVARDVRLRFRRGQIIAVTAKENEPAVEEYLKRNGAAARRFREFGLGFNPLLTAEPDSDVIPYFGYGAGVVRLSLGDNTELGGRVTGGFTRWFFFSDTTVEVVSRTIVREGALEPQFR